MAPSHRGAKKRSRRRSAGMGMSIVKHMHYNNLYYSTEYWARPLLRRGVTQEQTETESWIEMTRSAFIPLFLARASVAWSSRTEGHSRT